MKQYFTLLLVALTVNAVSAQSNGRMGTPPVATTTGSAGDFIDGVGRALGNGRTMGGVLFPAPSNTNDPQSAVNAQQEYSRLIDLADMYYREHSYQHAIFTYTNALAQKDEQYPKDQILMSYAEMERARKDQVLSSEAATEAARLIELSKVHFTGLVMSDHFSSRDLSKIRQKDEFSDFISPGKYANINAVLKQSTNSTLDGIAIPPGTRLVIYSKDDFEGEILLDVTGPAIINNGIWQNDKRYMEANSKDYPADLQGVYPQSVRKWSSSNMHPWSEGSMEITVQ